MLVPNILLVVGWNNASFSQCCFTEEFACDSFCMLNHVTMLFVNVGMNTKVYLQYIVNLDN